MPEPVDLDSRRPPPAVETLTLRIELAGPGDRNPKVTLESDGRPAAEIDMLEVGSALLYALLSLGNAFKHQTGEQHVPAAAVLVYRSGVLRVMAECSDFVSPVRQRWLDRCLEQAGPAFASLFESARSMPNNADPAIPG